MKNRPSQMTDFQTWAQADHDYYESLGSLLADSTLTTIEKFQNFAKYVPRQYLTYFLTRYEIFKRVLMVHGSVVECGVFQGGGLLTYAQLSAILEPTNHQRRIIGFDTFNGFPSFSQADKGAPTDHRYVGGMASNAATEIERSVATFDLNRSIAHIPKVEIIEGDVVQTVPAYLQTHPHLVVSLLVLDMDVFEPTRTALEHLLPRVPRGGIVVFDELNAEQWPGETVALVQSLGISSLRLERFPWDSGSCFAVIGD